MAANYDLDQRPSVAELLEHVNVSTKWRQVGIQLELGTKRLDAIDADCRDTDTKLAKMYEEWLSSTPNATRRQLLEVLRQRSINELNIANEYEGFCLGKSQWSDQEQQSIRQIKVVESNDCEQIATADTVHRSHEMVPTHSTLPLKLPKYVTDLLKKYSVPVECLNMKFTNDLLILLTLQIQNMEKIAPHFGMSEHDIQQIKTEKSNNGRVVSMLSKWRERNREGATCLSLIKIFNRRGDLTIIDSIISSIRNKCIPSPAAVTVPFDPLTYPDWNSRSDSEKEIIRNNLREETERVQNVFAKTFANIHDSFVKRQVDHLQVIAYLKLKCPSKANSLFPEIEHVQEKYHNINVLFMYFSDKCDWIDYHLLDAVTETYGSKEDKIAMTSYIHNELWPYLQRSLYEVPPESVGCHSLPTEAYHFALPALVKEGDEGDEVRINGQQLGQIKLLVAKLLRVPLEQTHIEFTRGSLIVHFVVDKQLFDIKDIKLFGFIRSDKPNTYYLDIDWIKDIPTQCWEPPKELCLCGEVYDTACCILMRSSEALSEIPLPIKLVQLLYTEGVISKEMLNEIESTGGYLTDNPLRALLSAVYMDNNKLRIFGTFLLRSKKTVPLANIILNEYDMLCNLVQYHYQLLETFTVEDISVYVDKISLNQLKDLFVKSISSIVPLIANDVSSLNELKLFLERAYVEMKPQLAHIETVDDVLLLVIEKCSLINVSCLEAVINHCDIKRAKEELTHYMTAVDEFCETTTISHCVNETFRLSSSLLLSCDTVQFVPKSTDSCSLSELRRLKNDLFGQFAEKVLIHSIEYKEFATVICYAPQHIRDCLHNEIDKSMREEIQMICISNIVLWNDYDFMKELLLTYEEINVDEVSSSIDDRTSGHGTSIITEFTDAQAKVMEFISKKNLLVSNKKYKEENQQLKYRIKRLEVKEKQRNVMLQENETLKSSLKSKKDVLHKFAQTDIQELKEKQIEIETLQEKVTSQNLEKEVKLKDYEILNQELSNKLKDTEKAKSMELKKLHQEMKEKQVEKELHETEIESERKVYQPEGRCSHTSNIVGNHLYVWSGYQSGLPCSHNDESKRKFTSCVEIMNLDTRKWKQAATTGNPPLGVAGYSSAVIENSILYFGGYCNHDNCFHNSVTRLNIDSLVWKELFPTNPHTGPMMKGRCGMIPVKIDEKNYLLVIGGYRYGPSANTPQQQNAQYEDEYGGIYTNEQHYFDLSTNQWISPVVSGDRPPHCRDFTLTALTDNTFIMFGGCTPNGRTNSLYIGHCTKSAVTWKQYTSPSAVNWPSVRGAHATAVVDEHHIILIGGSPIGDSSDCWILNVHTKLWNKLTLLQSVTERRWHSISSFNVTTDIVYVIVFGGTSLNESYISDTSVIELIRNDDGEWRMGEVMTHPLNDYEQ